MRLLFIIDRLDRGGKERQLYEIIRLLAGNSDIALGVITFNPNGYYSALMKGMVEYYQEIPKRPLKIEPIYKIWHPVKSFKPEVIHTWDSLSTMFAWIPSKVLNIPLVDGSIRDSGVDRGWQYYFRRFFMLRANVILANSRAGLRYYKVNGEVIYNAIDKSRFRVHGDKNPKVMIMIASFSDYKDHKTFLDAAARLIEAGIIDKALLAGEGKNLNYFKEYVSQCFMHVSNSIEFLGAVSNVEEVLEGCTYGVLCSTSKYGEGISNSVLEYMASGVISLVTDIGGSNEIIEHRTNGILFPEGNSIQLFEWVRDIESNSELRSSLRENALATIASKFSYDGNVNKLLECYRSIGASAQV